MSNPNNLPIPPAAPSNVDTESQKTPATGATQRQTPATGTVVGQIVERWKRNDKLKKLFFGLRCVDLLFSLLAFIIMASNKHGDWRDFDKYEEYR